MNPRTVSARVPARTGLSVEGSAVDDDATLALVRRLARPHRSGGHVIERAAILAEGANFPAVMEWIVAHAGVPESDVSPVQRGGLHGGRRDGGSGSPRPPLRFVLPPGALAGPSDTPADNR
jgi:hypothetical protein